LIIVENKKYRACFFFSHRYRFKYILRHVEKPIRVGSETARYGYEMKKPDEEPAIRFRISNTGTFNTTPVYATNSETSKGSALYWPKARGRPHSKYWPPPGRTVNNGKG
jgi:hypothetical protein